jgi:hypothetical protein
VSRALLDRGAHLGGHVGPYLSRAHAVHGRDDFFGAWSTKVGRRSIIRAEEQPSGRCGALAQNVALTQDPLGVGVAPVGEKTGRGHRTLLKLPA